MLHEPRTTPATFSPDRRHRFRLTRHVNLLGNSEVMFIMLNPSTADEFQDDPTVRRCIGFARSWGYEWLTVTNLSPLRATDPRDLMAAGPEPDDVREKNIGIICHLAETSDMVVAAWGVHGSDEDRAQRLIEHLDGLALHCLGTTQDGHPRHPLYIRSDAQPLEYRHGGKVL